MKIDLLATKKRLKDSGRSIAGWARANKFSEGTVAQFFGGYLPLYGPTGQRIIAALREDRLLVEQDEQAAA